MSIIDYYKLLGVSPNASPEDIKKAFRKMALLYHPDTAKNEESNAKFLQLQEAYNLLSDNAARRDYDTKHRLYSRTFEPIDVYKENQARTRKPTYRGREQSGTIDSARNWNILNNFTKQELEKIRGHKIEEVEEGGTNVMNKVKTFFQKTLNKENEKSDGSNQNLFGVPKKDTPRTYNFTISALESLNESHRELALELEDRQKKVRIKIPAGISDQTILKINIPADKDFPAVSAEVKVKIEGDNFMSRDADNLTLNIPVTPFEALSGNEIEIPSPKGRIKFKIPTPWKAEDKTKIKEHGLFSSSKNKQGDLFVSTYIVLPEHLNQTTIKAAKLLEESFSGDVRRNIPHELIKENK